MSSANGASSPVTGHHDAIVVGAGFMGVYALHRFRKKGMSVRLFEKGNGVGGTWFWNSYPGARCDVESMEYSFQFDEALQQEWEWTERYATQPEIRRYIEHVVDRFDLAEDMQLNTKVTSVVFDDEAGHWVIETDKGDRVTATYCVLATGCLSQPIMPGIDGLDTFNGRMEHTGLWPHEEIDFTGLRVGIIGTGSSGAQSLPEISKTAAEVKVFQRTPAYCVPSQNRPLDPESQAYMKRNYKKIRDKAWTTRAGIRYGLTDRLALEMPPEERDKYYEASWQRGGIGYTATFFDLFDSEEANETACAFVRKKIHEIVDDPVTAEKLCPYDVIGCRRLVVVNDFYESFNKPNVELVDVSETPIERVSTEGVVVGDQTHELDMIILATGFDAITGALTRMDIRGRNGVVLKDRMFSEPKALMGMMFSDFPNLFTANGPGAVAALSNIVPMLEFSVDWMMDCIEYLEGNGKKFIEPKHDAEDAWAKYVDDMATASLYVSCTSYYLGDNVPGKPRKFLLFQGVPEYVEKCTALANEGYTSFNVS